MKVFLFLIISLIPYLSFASVDTLYVGDKFSLSVMEENAVNVKLIGFTMKFDSSKVSADTISNKPSYTIGDAFKGRPMPTVATNFMGNNIGTIIAFVGYMGDSAISRNGSIIKYYFTAIDTGTVEFRFTKYKVEGLNNKIIPSIWESYVLPIISTSQLRFYIIITPIRKIR